MRPQALHSEVVPVAVSAAPAAGPRILLYSHDAAGSDSMRRTGLVAEALREEFPDAAIVVTTGSAAESVGRLPTGVDMIRLPGLLAIGSDRYAPAFLRQCSERIRVARREVLETAIEAFAPHLFVVDDHPLGHDGELVPALGAMRSQRPGMRCVLGIQDLKGAPLHLAGALEESHLFEMVEQLYDELWIYGSRDVFDTVREYGFPPALARKSHYCGYLQRRKVPSRSRSGIPRVLIVADDDATGGRIVECYLDGLRWLGSRLALRTTVCFDAQVSSELRNDLVRRFGHLSEVEFQDTVAHPERLYAQSDVVISTARYGNVCDILSFGHRAVLVPRAQPDWEQVIRAQRLAGLSLFEVIELHSLSPDVLVAKMLDALESGRRPRGAIDLGGLTHISERARAMLASPRWEGGLVENALAPSQS